MVPLLHLHQPLRAQVNYYFEYLQMHIECTIQLVECQNLNTSANCVSEWSPIQIETFGGNFFCYQWNYDANNVDSSISTSYGGGYATIWEIAMYQPGNKQRNLTL